MLGERANSVATFTIIKGTLISETYRAFQFWDLQKGRAENLSHLKDANPLGLPTASWIKNVVWAIGRRFEPGGRDRPLVELAKGCLGLEKWKPLMLWHMTRDEFLVRDFLISWLYPQYLEGTYRVRTSDLYPYLRELPKRGVLETEGWSENTLKRVATGLLRLAADFSLLTGKVVHEFSSFHLPEESFVYLLQAEAESGTTGRGIIQSEDWRMYLMEEGDVEREVMNLHQYRKVQYEVAGSLASLDLPHKTLLDCAKEMVA